MNRRIKQVNELIKQELSQIILRKIDFPEGVLVTVTRAETSPNLIQVKVFVSVIPESQGKKVLRLLNKEIFGLQQEINKRLKMRPVPKIKFIEEKQTQEAAKIEAILEKI
ncbi:MAG: ribosome-binding factor A [Candidatus Omnitrophica bacterium 4484_213]|nr:MAG: ribosome-binding factor A [Candidatus Omnitrophica bacterium 4484_213]